MSILTNLLRHPEIISGKALAHLAASGYCVIDGAMGAKSAARLRHEILELRNSGRFHLNSTQFVHPDGSSTSLLSKKDVWELSSEELESKGRHSKWGGPYTAHDAFPVLDGTLADASEVLHRLLAPFFAKASSPTSPEATKESAYSGSDFHLEKTTLKAQLNGGRSGCFPFHFDTAPGVDSRVITAIYYANEVKEFKSE